MHSKMTTVRSLAGVGAVTAALICGSMGVAQESPYADIAGRETKSLSADQTRGYLEGQGMGMALPGELNGYPGPKHVLELRQELGLSAGQLAEVQSSFDTMHQRAVELGKEIVEREVRLDELFAAGGIDAATLVRMTEEIGRLNGQLRGAHLRAHLETADVLSRHQRHLYTQLRGYEDGAAGEHGAHH